MSVPSGLLAKSRGLIGKSGADEAILLTNVASIHTFGVGSPIYACYLDKNYVVQRVVQLAPNRFGPRVRNTKHILETRFDPKAQVGDKLELIPPQTNEPAK